MFIHKTTFSSDVHEEFIIYHNGEKGLIQGLAERISSEKARWAFVRAFRTGSYLYEDITYRAKIEQIRIWEGII